MPTTIGTVSGLIMVCLVCILALADEPEKKAKEFKAPAGYEDAAEAGERPPARAAVVVGAREAAEVPGVVDAAVLNLEKQFTPQFTTLLTAELSFINRACGLNLEQRKKIKAVSDSCLKGAVRKYAMTQQGMMRGGFGGRGQRTMPDPTDLLHQALAKVLKETLRPEQQAAYDGEMAARKAHRKRVAIDNVVAIIDERLILTISQRQQLTQSLTKNWQPYWGQSIGMMVNSTQYLHLPNIPDQFVASSLNDTQKQVWRTAQKQSYTMFGGLGWGQQGGAVDDFPLAEVEKGVER